MRRQFGLLALAAVAVHILLSAFLWMPAYYPSGCQTRSLIDIASVWMAMHAATEWDQR